MRDVQKIIHSKIVKESNYGVDDDYTQGFIDGLSFALHRVVEHDGVNRTGCKEFNIKGKSE